MTSRPAEVTGAGGTVGALIAYVAGVKDSTTVIYIAAGVGLLPAVVTTVVANGGIRGLLRLVWSGKTPAKKEPVKPLLPYGTRTEGEPVKKPAAKK
jgi:hypothetical protein